MTVELVGIMRVQSQTGSVVPHGMADERLIALKMTEVPKRYCGEHIRIFGPLTYDFEQRNCKEGLHMIGVALLMLVLGKGSHGVYDEDWRTHRGLGGRKEQGFR